MSVRLIDKYSPVDYCDKFSQHVSGSELNVDQLFDLMFVQFPKPVLWLLKLRNLLVRPFGLKGGLSFRELIIERNDEEIIVGFNDKHLGFWVSVLCSTSDNFGQDAEVVTNVKYNNMLGKVYFALIFVFHKLIVGLLFKRAICKVKHIG